MGKTTKLEEALNMVSELAKQLNKSTDNASWLLAALQLAEKKAGKFDQGMIKNLIFLCHPDKHGNSELATKVTRKLLAMRKEASQ